MLAKYTSFAELINYASFTESQKKSLNSMTYKRLYDIHKKLYSSAKDNLTPEGRYIFYLRCGHTGIELQNNKEFKNLASNTEKDFVYKSTSNAINIAEALKPFLKKFYEDKEQSPPKTDIYLETDSNASISFSTATPTSPLKKRYKKDPHSQLPVKSAASTAHTSSIESGSSSSIDHTTYPTSIPLFEKSDDEESIDYIESTLPIQEMPHSIAIPKIDNFSRNIPPQIDRSTKPGILSQEDQNQLIMNYNIAFEHIYKSSLIRRPLNMRPGITGIFNMGNTCFMNACLQALFQTPMLSETFSENRFLSKVNILNSLGTRGVISATFSALLDSVWHGIYVVFKPYLFINIFRKHISSLLIDGEQQDASEFYLVLLASLHEDTNQVVNGTPPIQEYGEEPDIRKSAADFDIKQRQYSYSPISKILYPRIISEVACSVCEARSITFEEVNIIQVELPPESEDGKAYLVDCLHRSFRVTSINGKWDCPRCKTARSASQKRSVWKLSPVIVICLLRFSFTGDDYVKNNIPVIFNAEDLDMSQFLHSSTDRAADSSYKLYSITNHRGRLNSGHYTAFSRHLKTGEWMRADDEHVSPANLNDIDFSSAYILYFKKKDL